MSDDKLRANYDAGGKTGVEDVPKMDSNALFAMIFGSEKFEPLLGELKLASHMSESQNGGEFECSKLRSFKQRKRILQCALNLAKKLDGYVVKVIADPSNNSNLEEFRRACFEEAKELAESPFGGTLVAAIGDVYSGN